MTLTMQRPDEGIAIARHGFWVEPGTKYVSDVLSGMLNEDRDLFDVDLVTHMTPDGMPVGVSKLIDATYGVAWATRQSEELEANDRAQLDKADRP
jgi:hypothetical protein